MNGESRAQASSLPTGSFSEPHQNAIATELVEILDEKQNSFLMGDFPFCREESGLCGSVSRALV